MVRPHILLVAFPGQGHINPALEFAKRMVRLGVEVTFATTKSAERLMVKNTVTSEGLSFATFSDGHDSGYNLGKDGSLDHYMSELRRHGSRSLSELIVTSANNGRPFTCLVYCPFTPWVTKVARELHLPSIFLWNQPATVLEIYYYYFHGYGDSIDKNINNPGFSLELPGLPPLGRQDVPSFFHDTGDYPELLQVTKEQLELLDEETNPKVIVNTFDALEPEALKSIEKYNLIAVGPLVPCAFMDGKDSSDTSVGGDLHRPAPKEHYIQWLNSKAKSSVIYISLGSFSVMSKPQMEEMGRALLNAKNPFLWVIRSTEKEDDENLISCREELEQQGMIVPWCSQMEVLSHPSIGCFVTHCGWNSTFESLASGVPMVTFPQWTDQFTNSKLVEDVWRIGVRFRLNEEKGLVESEEIRRCLDIVMGGGEEQGSIRSNARKWKELSREASMEGGSSSKNLQAFVDEIGNY